MTGARVAIPMVLTLMWIEPAPYVAVILTTVTDIVGFLCFPGLAMLFLLQEKFKGWYYCYPFILSVIIIISVIIYKNKNWI